MIKGEVRQALQQDARRRNTKTFWVIFELKNGSKKFLTMRALDANRAAIRIVKALNEGPEFLSLDDGGVVVDAIESWAIKEKRQ